jgi:CBS domain-containing protein
MKGSSISLRIADFLKEYPPFNHLGVETLRDLASQSKVTFHEDGEIVFSKGQPRDRWLYVIQKGNLRVVDEGESGDHLVDLRGPGDILGLQGIRSDEPYLHTCRTDTETILYGLPRDAFVKAAGKVAKARRYLAAYFSLNPAYQWGTGREADGGQDTGPVTLMRGGLAEVINPQVHARDDLVTVQCDAPLQEAVRHLQSKRVECVLVVDDHHHPIGKLTDADLRDRILESSLSRDCRVGDIMFTDLVSAGQDENTGQLLIKLIRHGKHFLVITEDGSLDSPALGLISERNLLLEYARFPTLLGEAISSAPDVPSLRRLRDRLEALILEFLDSRDALDWLMTMTGVMNRKMSRRILELVEAQMEREGWGAAPCSFSWLMMGSGGRDELLIRSALYHALVYSDPDPGATSPVLPWFRELARRSADALRQCGFLESPQNVLAQNPDWCLSLGAMKERFSRMMADPVGQHVYSARDAFDFRPLEDGCPFAEALGRHIEEEIKKHPGFIRHMAMDSLMNQPPRTLFKGYVVDREGIRREELAIKFHALLPLVDVARVLSLENGNREPTGTYQRLRACALADHPHPEWPALFEEAAEAFRVALFARISQGLRNGTDGAVIQPSALDAQERTLLKTAFRTILSVLEVTSDHFNLDWNG